MSILNFLKIHRFKLKYAINGIWAVPLVFLVRLIRPLILIRFGFINSVRIGHFVPDGSMHYVNNLNKETNRIIEVFWVDSRVSNEQWLKMLKRNLHIYNWSKMLDWANQIIPGGKAHYRQNSLNPDGGNRDFKGIFSKNKFGIPFTDDEILSSKEWLKSKGWSEGEPFICLIARDSNYLGKHPFYGNNQEEQFKNYSYHNFRDSEINTYLPALEWLADQGVWVLRMGKIMERQLVSNKDKIIDYAFLKEKNDLLDIWLFANCTACISTACGPDYIPYVYNKPLLFLNALPLSEIWSFANNTRVPKTLSWKDSNHRLSLNEHLENTYYLNNSYIKAGIEVKDLTSDEILLYVKDYWLRFNNKNILSKTDKILQSQFWIGLKKWEDFSQYHGWINPKSIISPAWLKNQNSTFFKD
jgi:putative glycosyltransferase (TIGR04372 family)